jgi:polyketide biosynthesis acyl carrier protein
VTAAERTEVRRMVVETVRSILPGAPADLDDSASFRDLGADSIDRVEIMTEVRDRLAAERPLSAFAELTTVGAVVDYLVGELA